MPVRIDQRRFETSMAGLAQRDRFARQIHLRKNREADARAKTKRILSGQLLRAAPGRIRSADEFDSHFRSRWTQDACCRRSRLSKRRQDAKVNEPYRRGHHRDCALRLLKSFGELW